MSPVTPKTRELFAKKHMSQVTVEDLIAWAVSMLESGYDTKNLGILASLTGPLYSSEVEDYFERSVRELGWDAPKPEENLRWYTRYVAAKILSGETKPFEGCKQIYETLPALSYPRHLIRWSCLYLGHDPDTYEDLGDLSDEGFNIVVQREAKLLLDEKMTYAEHTHHP